MNHSAAAGNGVGSGILSNISYGSLSAAGINAHRPVDVRCQSMSCTRIRCTKMRPGAVDRCGRQARLLVLWTLVCLAHRACAQEGFISIDCGASPGANYVDPNTTLTWEGDAAYLATGVSASVAAGSAGYLSVPLRTVRYFPAGSSPRKNCYVMPAQLSQIYLIRASFFYGNYDGHQTIVQNSFQLSLDSTPWSDVSVDPSSSEPLVLEAIRVPLTSDDLSVCLIRTDDSFAPFINTLEIRPVNASQLAYTFQPTGGNLHLLSRANFGERVKTYRFPQDPFDRIWPPYLKVYPSLLGQVTDISTSLPILDSPYDKDVPPEIVMQTAITAPSSFNFTDNLPTSGPTVLYVSLLIADYNTALGPGMQLIVNVSNTATGVYQVAIPIVPHYVAPLSIYQLQVPDVSLIGGDQFTWYFFKNENSTLDPVLSATELYTTQALAKSSLDGGILNTLRKTLPMPTWGGDPCFPIPWDEVQCNSDGRVTFLNLSGKNLTGEIPADIGGLTALTTLILSNNSFTGVIPSELQNLTSLTSLDVSDNKLSGLFPTWFTLLPFSELDVSNNNLIGVFPDSLLRSLGSSFRYSGNPQLSCSGPSCPASATPPPTPPASPPPPSSKPSNSSVGPVVGGIVGGIVFILVLGLLLFYCLRRPIAKKPSQPVTPEELSGIGQAHPFTLRDIQIATRNYSRQIGTGGFGPVFHGVLIDNREVAVKRMATTSKQGFHEFMNEIGLLSTIHHRNLVSLVGYCEESSDLLLLYEYMAGGDLAHRLHGPTPLSWIQRLQIAVDAAKGLEYLHHGCNPRIIHRDVKSTNILLTSTLEAKVSDFGLSKLTGDGRSHVTTIVKGTLGYLDPEYFQTAKLTDKSDVFSFGVVLLELMCGRSPILPELEMGENGESLVDLVRSAMNGGSIDQVVDPRLAGRYRSDSVWNFAETAVSCVSMTSSKRPTFVKVVTDLKEALHMEQQHAPAYPSGEAMTPEPVSGGWSVGPYTGEEMPSVIFHSGEQPAAR